MLRVIKKNFLGYIIELVIAVVFISISIEAFLVYALMSLAVKIDYSTNYLRSLNIVFNLSTQGKLVALVRKMGISDEDLFLIGKEVEDKLTPEEKKDLAKAYKEITT